MRSMLRYPKFVTTTSNALKIKAEMKRLGIIEKVLQPKSPMVVNEQVTIMGDFFVSLFLTSNFYLLVEQFDRSEGASFQPAKDHVI